jgi:hypothetical protein
MINIDNPHIYKGNNFSPFVLFLINYKLGITKGPSHLNFESAQLVFILSRVGPAHDLACNCLNVASSFWMARNSISGPKFTPEPKIQNKFNRKNKR